MKISRDLFYNAAGKHVLTGGDGDFCSVTVMPDGRGRCVVSVSTKYGLSLAAGVITGCDDDTPFIAVADILGGNGLFLRATIGIR